MCALSILRGYFAMTDEDVRHSQNNKKQEEACAARSGDLKKIKESACSKLLCPYSCYLQQEEEARRDRQHLISMPLEAE